jgi:hypothetical protein
MNAWVNIVVPPDDEEIASIDRLEQSLGNIPKHVCEIRELITRFETCHFKYQQHYQHIIESIVALRPVIEVNKIGSKHPGHNSNDWRNDTTGRSRVGRQYISALRFWLEEELYDDMEAPREGMLELRQRVNAWLGDRDDVKERLVRKLLNRLLWRSLNGYRSSYEPDGLEYQIEATDICNYAFPQNLERLLQGIGEHEPVRPFDGCGTYDSGIESYISKEFSKLSEWLKADTPNVDLGIGNKDPIRVWLVACLAKTMKSHVHLADPLPEFVL